MPLNYIKRSGKFEAAHRLLHERYKCFNLHGHSFQYELTLTWERAEGLGYAIDFQEIKRIVGGWIEARLDHGFIANPKDTAILTICKELGLKTYEMHLIDSEGFCNPSSENMAKEIFFATGVLLKQYPLKPSSVLLHETTHCSVECTGLSENELHQLQVSQLYTDLNEWLKNCGTREYDDRKSTL